MSYYKLANVCRDLTPPDIGITFVDEIDADNYKADNYISLSLAKCLDRMKEKISEYRVEWDTTKRITNPCEYVHTVVPGSKYSISRLKPVSRAFYKFVEVVTTTRVLRTLSSEKMRSLHVAEGPGGFIEAISFLRANKEDNYVGMTLINHRDPNVPGWKKSELVDSDNITFEYGEDGTGDIYRPENYVHCLDKYGQSFDLITGDGGFDFSADFCNQESLALHLIFCQIAYAVGLQAPGGILILKIFDTFLRASADLLYILSCFYTSTRIIKPSTSRYANSERYIVCTGFRLTERADIIHKFLSIMHVLSNMNIKSSKIAGFLTIPINRRYRTILEEVNAILGQQQIDNILTTIRAIENKEIKGDRTQQMRNQNIQKCIQWCARHKIAYNKNVPSGNIFMNDRLRRGRPQGPIVPPK